MKLVNSEMGIDLELKENEVNLLVVEDPISLREIIEGLNEQCKGVDGDFVLSHNHEPLPLTKNIELIVDPFNIDLNSKKIQTKIYELIIENINNDLLDKFTELNQSVVSFLDISLLGIPFPIDYGLELDAIGLLKLYHVGIQKENNNFAENIVEYIRILNNLMNINVILFVNLKNFLSESELKEVYKFANYSKINLVLIECQRNKQLNEESLVVVDKDQCVIRF